MSPQSETYHTQKFPDEPIILVEINETYNVARDLPRSRATAIELLDAQTEPVFYIIDISALKHVTVNDTVDAANMGGGSADSLYRHPMIREIIVISEQKVVEMGVKGMDSDAFGHISASVKPSLNEALAYARAKS